jgi:uncharacterized protein involved in outer membrane biogenesis
MPRDFWPFPGDFSMRSNVRLRRGLYWLGGVLVAIAVLGFLVAPLLIRPALEKNLSAALDRKVSIARLEINPFAMSATLHDVSIGERGEGPPLLTMTEMHLNGQLASLFRWAPVLSAVRATQPALHLVRNSDKTYNFSDLLDRALAEPAGPAPRFAVSNIEIIDGRIDFDDRPEHRQHQIRELRLGIPFLSSLPSQTEIKVEPTFSAWINERPVAISGETRPFMDTHETVLHFDIGELPLPAYIDYVPVSFPVKVESGVLNAKADLSFIGRGKNPPQLTLAGAFQLSDLALSERSGAKLARVPSLAVAIDRFDIFGNALELRSIAANGIELEVRRGANGELNLGALVPPDATPKGNARPFGFRATRVSLDHGTVRISDASVKPEFASTLSDVSLSLKNLGSSPNQKADVAFSFASDTGARVSHSGTLALGPLRADGRLEMSGLKLARLFPFYAGALNLVVDDGTLDGSTDFRYDGANDALTLANLDAKASDLKMRLPDEKEPLWRVPVLTVRGGAVDVPKRAISFESIESRGAVGALRRGADGTFNFDRLLRRAEGSAPPASGGATAPGAPAWNLQSQKVAFDDIAATFNDGMVTPPARIALTRIALNAENVSTAAKTKGRVSLQATVNKRGTISLSGPITSGPFAATLNVVAKGIDVVPFAPYISRSARVVVTGGNVSADGAVDFAAGTSTRAGFKGNVVLGDVVSLDEVNQWDLLKWKTLRLGTIDAQLEPLAVTVGDIALDNFFARLLLNENGEFNLQQLGREHVPAAAPPKPTMEPKTVEVATPPGTATTWLKLGKATLTNGSVDYTDRFIKPNYSANLTRLNGGLSTLAFDQPANIELHGSVQGSAPVEITGRINPLGKDLFLDIKANATDIELPPLTPYSSKYVGYGIEKGKLSMKVSYLIEDRKLKAENSVTLDQLTFGQRVESPDAIKAPVLLAVALLKDRNGVIKFDLPVGGSLDDPQFSVGGLVFRAIINLIVKIVTSPFAILGSLGGHGEELAYIEFAAGSATLDKASQEKLDAIVKALTDRPAVKLDVAGRIDPAQDREALQRVAVERQVRALKFNDLVRSGEPPSSVDAVEVSAAEYESLLKRVYREASIPSKPKNAIGFPKDLPREEMETLLHANVTITDEDLRSLANRRADVVRASLTDGKRVPEERVFILAPHLSADGVKDQGKPTRVDFALH